MLRRIFLVVLSTWAIGTVDAFSAAPATAVAAQCCTAYTTCDQRISFLKLRSSVALQGSSFTRTAVAASTSLLPALSQRQHSRRPMNPQMVISVLGALTAPVVVIAAMGTLDGFGKIALNVPRILDYQFKYATRIMAVGNGPNGLDLDPLNVFRNKLEESTSYRKNALRLFVKYDTNGDCRIDELELTRMLATEPLFQTGLPENFGAKLISSLKSSKDIGAQEFLSMVRGTPISAEETEQLLQDAMDFKVDAAYWECRELTSEYAKTFFLATLAMEAQQAKATWAIYAWCRRVDEIVDGPNVDPDPAVQRAALEEWNDRLDRMYRGDADNTGLDNFDVAFRDMIKSFPGSDIEPYRDMVRGMVMDIDQDVYSTWDDLYLYCYRVASTVGLMTLPVMGTAEGVTVEEAREPAVALGIALQITNILRDVGEDARDRGRIYLPQADLERFGVTPESIFERAKNGGAPDDNYVALMKFEIARAREYYSQAEAGIAMLAPGAQLPVAVASELYKSILDKIELNGYDNFNTRAYLSSEEKMMAVPPLWFKTVTGGWEKVRRQAEATSLR